MNEYQNSKNGSIASGSGHHIEVLITTFMESIAYYMNHHFTNLCFPPITNPPSTRFFYVYSSYYSLFGSTTTQYPNMNPSYFGFTEGLGKSYFSTTLVVYNDGASSLLKTLVTQVTSTQPLAHTSSFAHESGNILASLFPHMHKPSSLLGLPIGHMISSQVLHTTIVTQSTHLPYHTSHIITPYIGGQYSMGGQP